MASAQAAPRRRDFAGGHVVRVATPSPRMRRHAVETSSAMRGGPVVLVRRVGAFLAWWLAMGGIVVAAFALAFVLCALA